MNIILNKTAGSGCAERKWELIKRHIFTSFQNIKVLDVNQKTSLESAIIDSIKAGDYNFIIAGGDGTINIFTNKLLSMLDESTIKKIKIGAVGIGSSNDFCKPFDLQSCIEKIPCKINFNNVQLRDVGVIKYRLGSQMLKKYFLLNASIGVTAQANNLFNYPNKQLSFLKARFKDLAIIYAAIKTIFTYKDFKVKVMCDSDEEYSVYISNLSIIKNPNISGNLSYPVKADYQSGMFDVFLAHSMNKIKLIKLLLSLAKKKFPLNDKSKHYKTSKLTLKASDDFLVEFDGEIIKTNYAEFTILNKYLNVCVN